MNMFNVGTYCINLQGVRGEGRFYYEARVIESNGLARIGWTTEDGSLLVGTDSFGFGYGSDCEGFGLSGQQGKRLHNNEIDNYGEVTSALYSNNLLPVL